MAIKAALTDLLGIEHPVLLAPMARVSGGALAAAVTRAGGLGLIGGGYGDGDWIEAQFAAAGNQRVGLGFITWSLAEQPALLDRALAHGPAVVMLSFGDPAPFAAAIKAAGARLICQVQTVAQAKQAAAAGAEVIVAQGCDAGGHSGERATLPLVPAVVDAVAPLPVVAAGGIGDGRGLAAALTLGAVGVLLGTRFYASEEADVHANAKARVTAASGDETCKSPVFDRVRGYRWPEPYGLRSIENAFVARWRGREEDLLDDEAAQTAHAAAYAAGDVEQSAVLVGEAAGLIDAVLPAGEIVARIVQEAERALGQADRLLS